MNDGQSRSSPPIAPGYGSGGVGVEPAGTCVSEVGEAELRRRRVQHDIHHELATIIMLASVVAGADDVGPASRQRIDTLIGETRWLDHLLHQLHDTPTVPRPERIRVDELTADIVTAMRLASPHGIAYLPSPASAHIDALALWRVLRNILNNACRAAASRVDVSVYVEDAWTVIQVDDDGPGFGAAPGGMHSLGLGIVHDLITGYHGALEIHHTEHGGARVRILLPAAGVP